MAKYVVEVVVSTCMAIEVEAHDEAEAQALALEEANPFSADDWEYENDCEYRDGDDDDEDEDEEEEEEEDEGFTLWRKKLEKSFKNLLTNPAHYDIISTSTGEQPQGKRRLIL